MLAYFDGVEVRLVNRRLNDRTAQYPELHNAAAYCRASSFILDGELIALDDKRPAFHEIMKRDRLKKAAYIEKAVKQVPVTFMVFDMLYSEGEWLTARTLAERQSIMNEALIPQPYVQPVVNFTDKEGLLDLMKQHQMEGVVYKDLTSTYAIGGKDKRWQKHKIFHDLYAVVGGVTYRDKLVNALLLGVYDDAGRLHYIGHAGTGKVTMQQWRDVTKEVAKLVTPERPFADEPERAREATWLKPTLVVKVQFMEWTPGGTMRHPSIQSFVDIAPEQCRTGQ